MEVNESDFVHCPACKGESAIKAPAQMHGGQSVWLRNCQLCGFVTQLHIHNTSRGVRLRRIYDSKPNSFPIAPQPTNDPLIVQEKMVKEVQVEGADDMVLNLGDEDSEYAMIQLYQNDDIGILPDSVKISEEEAKNVIETRLKQRRGFICN